MNASLNLTNDINITANTFKTITIREGLIIKETSKNGNIPFKITSEEFVDNGKKRNEREVKEIVKEKEEDEIIWVSSITSTC